MLEAIINTIIDFFAGSDSYDIPDRISNNRASRTRRQKKLMAEEREKQKKKQIKVARAMLRLKLEALYAHYKNDKRRISKIKRLVHQHPQIMQRNLVNMTQYLSTIYKSQKRIEKELAKLLDYPIDLKFRGDYVTHVKLINTGWITFNKFLNKIEKGELPYFTLRNEAYPVLLPWFDKAMEMLNLQRNPEFPSVFQNCAHDRK